MSGRFVHIADDNPTVAPTLRDAWITRPVIEPLARRFLSIVAPCFNEAASLLEFHRQASDAARAAIGEHYEIVLVNDGSRDRTLEVMRRLVQADRHVLVVDLSRNFGHQRALLAGLTVCRGDRVLVIDADLQDPPGLLAEMMPEMDAGADVVYAQRRRREGETLFKTATARMFYRLLRRMADTPIPADTGDFRLISRRALTVLLSMPEQSLFVRGMVSWIGLRQVPVMYDRKPRQGGESGYPLRKMLAFAIDAITGFSIVPLRFATWLGLGASAFSLTMNGYALASWLTGSVVAGWTSLAGLVLTLGSIQLLLLGVLGEYVGRIYIEFEAPAAVRGQRGAPASGRGRPLRRRRPHRGAAVTAARDPCAGRLRLLFDPRFGWWVVLGAEALVLLTPLFLVDLPPLLDWPNHLARMHVLAFGADDPVLSRMYAARWAVIPNLAIDVIMPPLLHVMPLYSASRIVLAAALLLPLAGVVLYSRTLLQRRSFWPLAAGLVSYNAIFILGFVNLCIANGAALVAAAYWHAGRERRPLLTASTTAVLAVAIFFCHAFGMLFLFLLMAGSEAAGLFARLRRGDRFIVWAVQRAALGSLAAIPALLLYFRSSLHDVGGGVRWNGYVFKLAYLFGPFIDYYPNSGAFVAVCVALIVLACAVTRRLRVSAAAAITGLLLLIAYLVAPSYAKDTAFIDARLPIMLGLLMFAGIAPVRVPPRMQAVIAAALVLLFLVRTGGVATAWIAHRADVADVRTAIASVPAGSRVLVTAVRYNHAEYWSHSPPSRRLPGYMELDRHIAALLLLERHAFWPLLFTAKSKQPLVVLPPYAALAENQVALPDFTELARTDGNADLQEFPYLRNWAEAFDYVLLIDADGVGDPDGLRPDRLRLLTRTPYAVLFRVIPPSQRKTPGSFAMP